MKRGVVASPMGFEVLAGGGFMQTTGLSETDLNYYSLYWDEIIIPGSKEFRYVLPNEEELIKLGVITRPLFSTGYNTDLYPTQFPAQQLRIFEEMQRDNLDCLYVLHQIGVNLNLPTSKHDDFRNLQFELFNALPVPSKYVRPEQVLEFKTKHRDALNSLHNYLDELYENVASAPDEPLFKKKAYADFNDSLKNINRISEMHKGFSFDRYSMKLEMPNSKDFTTTVLGALTAIADVSNPLVTGLGLLTAGIGFVKVTDKYGEMLNSENKNANLLYLAELYKDRLA